MFWLHFRRGNI